MMARLTRYPQLHPSLRRVPVVLFVLFCVQTLLVHWWWALSSLAGEDKASLIAKNVQLLNASPAILPISFSLPDSRYETAVRVLESLKKGQEVTKNQTFATIVPGDKRTYIYDTESAYYEGYRTALFGITFKKSGWDCFRHYEILAAGAIPYFLDLDDLPGQIMHSFPKQLLQRAMSLPGVPTQDEVRKHIQTRTVQQLSVDESLFDRDEYNKLLQEMIEYSVQHLTWSATAQYFLSSLRRLYPCAVGWHPHVLFVSTRTCEYMSCTLYGGLHMALGSNMTALQGPKDELYKSFDGDISRSYGKGISYSREFDDDDDDKLQSYADRHKETQRRLSEGFFDVIVFTNAENRYCNLKDYGTWWWWWWPPSSNNPAPLLSKYQAKFDPLVVVVDGSDTHGCHDFFSKDRRDTLEYHVRFIREYDDVLYLTSTDSGLLSHWENSDGECKKKPN